MTPVSVAVKIWAKTIFLNAFLFGIISTFNGDFLGMLGAGLILIGGLITTLPLLILIAPLIGVSNRLPYGIPAKTTWLTFFLLLLIVLIYMWASWMLDDTLFKAGSIENRLLGTTIAGLLIAVLTTKRSLNKLYTQSLQ